ncbi:MAG: hypothetical protein HN704_13150 [Bacteroidetes bacterium]|jgi:hypothetical protein|nr:hypothetical protein [Bacteroidota bacterium]MBT6687775.1 hypothetical protein [Bacteroidota bacterium]MBT7143409.1 hypothetical protein [Bacteroidota bacterium]MBT7492543.1 hypothetical protein [Bacteroidota bacterium]
MKCKNFFTIVFLCLISLTIYSQNIQWQEACSFGGSNYFYGSTFDYDDNVIVQAEYWVPIVFNDTIVPCPQCYNGTIHVDLTSKTDLDGNLLIQNLPLSRDMVVDQQNNFYCTDGYFGSGNLFKKDSNGNHLWSKQFSSNSASSNVYINTISISDNNSVCVAGVFFGGTALIAGYDTLAMQDTIQAFAALMDFTGNIEWIGAFPSLDNVFSNNEYRMASALDSNENAYVYWDYAIYKINQGNIVWQQHFPDFIIFEIEAFNNDDLFCIGSFYCDTINIGNFQIINDSYQPSLDFLMARIVSVNANVIWAKSGINISGNVPFYLFSIDQYDNIYFTTRSGGNIYLDSIYLQPTNYVRKDILMCNSNGICQWVEEVLPDKEFYIWDFQFNQDDDLLLLGEIWDLGNYFFGEDTLNITQNQFIFAKANLSSAQMQSQNITLDSSWSMFSTYIEPANNDIENIFSPIVQNVIIVKDGVGMVYWPQYNLDNLDSFSVGMGYQIKMNAQNTLQVSGEQIIPENVIIPYPAGWSLIGFLLDSIAPLETYLSPIVSEISLVKDDLGNVFWPLYNINNIGNMTPGKGYQMKLANAMNFTYTPPQ